MTVPRRLSRAAGLAVLAAIPLAGLLLAPAAEAANGLPYTDPRSQGSITLCDASGHAITSGNIHDRPTFAWVVSSQAAPPAYGVKTGKATVYAYQPRAQVNPADWSGQQISGSSLYNNPAHPMAQVTTGDKPIGDFVAAYPPQWDGLIQLRIYLTVPNHLAYQVRYPTTDLKITGSVFTVVDPGNTPCTVGRAVSSEHLLLPASAFPKPSAASPRPSTGTGATSGPTPGANVAGVAVTPSTVPVAAGTSATADPPSGGSGANPILVGLLVVAVIGAAGTAVFILRSRSATH